MKVKLLTSLAGVNFAHSAGDEYECSADEGQRLIDKGMAEAIRAKKVERAVLKARTEKAVR